MTVPDGLRQFEEEVFPADRMGAWVPQDRFPRGIGRNSDLPDTECRRKMEMSGLSNLEMSGSRHRLGPGGRHGRCENLDDECEGA